MFHHHTAGERLRSLFLLACVLVLAVLVVGGVATVFLDSLAQAGAATGG